MDLAITGAEVIPYALAFRDPYFSSAGTLQRREIVLLRVRSEHGATGLGEAVPLALRGGAPLASVVEELRDWAGAPSRATGGLSSPAHCAVETALLDLEARISGLPLWSLLGADAAAPVACNATLAAGEPNDVARRALDWARAGFSSFKLKVGVPRDVEQVAQVRREVGAEARLRVDANGAWDAEEASEKLGAMHEHRLELAEQPCRSLSELAALRERVEVPISADESVAGADDARRALEQGACDLATAKLSKVGGPRQALAVAAVLPTYLSSALDGPVGIAAAAHVAQAMPVARGAGVAHGIATQRLFGSTIAARECELRYGYLELPEGPGLGVEIDDAALERQRL